MSRRAMWLITGTPLYRKDPLGCTIAELRAMEDVIEDHISDGAIEEYSLDKLAESRAALIEEHLRVCKHCRTRLESIEPVSFVHFTEDGPVYSRATLLGTGEVMARHWGTELDGGRIFGNVSAARKYLNESFAQMFPDHICKGRCGQEHEQGHR
jgi:hypothetical protein